MLPSKSNLSKENCSPISSNCVIWQGPDIECINLCNGDTVSDVTYKLAEEICILKENIGVTDVDLTCLVKVCQTTPEPSKTLANILDLLISKVCCLSDIVKNLPSPGTPYVEPTLSYPACAAFAGLTPVLHSQYTISLAQKICTINATVSIHTAQLNDHESRIDTLEGLVPTPLPQLPSCLSGTALSLDVLVENLETEFCDLKDALGDSGDLTVAADQICENLNSQTQLMDSTETMSGITGWVLNPQNFAESVNNLWLTVCDIRSAVRSILDNCCAPTCDAIKIDFYQRWSSTDPNILQLNFRSKSSLPVGFYDCGQPGFPLGTNQLTFTDHTGFSVDVPILFRHIDYPTNTTGALDDDSFGWYDIDLTGSGLVFSQPITLTGDICFTNGTLECVQCINFTIQPSTDTCCEIVATGPVTIVYKTC
jgi:hypothetical protein